MRGFESNSSLARIRLTLFSVTLFGHSHYSGRGFTLYTRHALTDRYTRAALRQTLPPKILGVREVRNVFLLRGVREVREVFRNALAECAECVKCIEYMWYMKCTKYSKYAKRTKCATYMYGAYIEYCVHKV